MAQKANYVERKKRQHDKIVSAIMSKNFPEVRPKLKYFCPIRNMLAKNIRH